MSSHPTLAEREGHSATTSQTESESIISTTSNAGASPPRGGPSESSLMVVHCWMAEELTRGYITIDIFPDEILLEIFAFYLCGDGDEEEWQTLVHVCRRWRSIVFGSPLTLNLRIVCTNEADNEALDIWPAFPIIIWMTEFDGDLEDDLLNAFKHRDRICEIHVDIFSDDGLDELPLVMEEPFPKLTVLDIRSKEDSEPFLPDSFLGGSAPSLRSLYLQGIDYEALPTLLSSAPGLVRLHLVDIPFGYISPEEMVDSLSLLTKLEQLEIHYLGPCSDPSRRPPPLTRTVLPVLTSLAFSGEGDFLDHLFARTQFPLLKDVDIAFRPPVIFNITQISRFINFIGHTEAFEASDQAHMLFNRNVVEVTLSSSKGATDDTSLRLSMRCRDSVWQLAFLNWVRRPFSPPFPTRDSFDCIEWEDLRVSRWADDVETRWGTVLQLFTAVENLYLSVSLTDCVMLALQDNAAEQVVVTEVLPALQNIFLESPERCEEGVVHEAIEKFVAARELSGRPVTVQHWVK